MPPTVLVLGIPELDADHEKLGAILQELESCCDAHSPADVCVPLVSRLVAAAQEHFANEERLMQRCGYQHIQGHADEHRHFLNVARSLESALRDGSLPLNQTVVAFLWDWLNDHIDSADRPVAEHLRAASGQP